MQQYQYYIAIVQCRRLLRVLGECLRCRNRNIRPGRSCPAHSKPGVLRTQDAHHLWGAQTQTGRPCQERERSSVDSQTSVHRQHVSCIDQFVVHSLNHLASFHWKVWIGRSAEQITWPLVLSSKPHVQTCQVSRISRDSRISASAEIISRYFRAARYNFCQISSTNR